MPAVAREFMSKNLTKLIFIALFLITIVSLFEFVVILKLTGVVSFGRRDNQILSFLKKTTTTQPLRRVEGPTIEVTTTPIPLYTVTIPSSPTNNGTGLNFKVDIKNISVSPFMTRFILRDCKFVDGKGNVYSGMALGPEGGGDIRTQFSKALLPGESKTVEFARIGINLNGGGGISGGSVGNGQSIPKCTYAPDGNRVCVSIEGIKFKECTAVTSINDKPEELFPIVVSFP